MEAEMVFPRSTAETHALEEEIYPGLEATGNDPDSDRIMS
jgi:hypothetical protein